MAQLIALPRRPRRSPLLLLPLLLAMAIAGALAGAAWAVHEAPPAVEISMPW